jgi:diguanylate cyclase (GGDEF)-like protein
MGLTLHRRPPRAPAARRARLLVRRWAIGTVLLALVGVTGSWIAARADTSSDVQHSHQLFRLQAAQVSANLNLEVQHETDLLVGSAAFLQEHPDRDTGGFQRWTDQIQAVKRYPELISLVEMRPRADLAACPTLTFAGPPWIMLHHAEADRTVCRGVTSRVLALAGDRQMIYGLRMLGLCFLVETASVYRGAAAPATLAARERSFVGAIALALYPKVLMRDALRGFRGVNVELETTSYIHLTFSSGPRIHGARATTPLSDGLTAVITGAVNSGSLWHDNTTLLLLGAGSTLSLLLALALFLLGTGRARAMRLVSEKTGELEFQALHDGLTGLPNRMLVMDRIEHALARSHRLEQPVAVLFIDFDGFKTVNDTFGHGAGDQLLRVVGSRLNKLIRDADTVGRLGGDEFVVVLGPGDSRPAPEVVAERILELLNLPIELGNGVEVRLTASVGIAVGQRDSTEALLRDADLALYAAKQGGKNRFVVFEAEMQDAIAERHALELDLRRAVSHNELYLVYQPTFRLGDRSIAGVEALVRWQHPTRGLIAPDDFIPIAEDSGLILEIGRWVATEACRQAAAWRERGLDLGMAINVSGRQIDEIDFADQISAVLARTGLEASALTLEITETSLMRNPQEASKRLRRLKRLTSACESRSTISGPATARSPTCSGSRSTRSRSTAPSSAAWTAPTTEPPSSPR